MEGNKAQARRGRTLLDREKQGYLLFGVLTTIVNYGLYVLFRELFGVSFVVLNTALAWFGAVCFAYYTNRRWVFQSQRVQKRAIAAEFAGFVLSRIATGLLDVGIMAVFSGWIGFNDLLVKILANIVVIVLNYLLSKRLVFGNPSNK